MKKSIQDQFKNGTEINDFVKKLLKQREITSYDWSNGCAKSPLGYLYCKKRKARCMSLATIQYMDQANPKQILIKFLMENKGEVAICAANHSKV